MGKAVARSSKCALVREAMKDPGTKHYIITRIGLLVREELQLLCSDKTNSVLKSQSVSHLRKFSWDTFTSDLSTNAPILWSLLYASAQTRRPAQNWKAVIGICIPNCVIPKCALFKKLFLSYLMLEILENRYFWWV